MHYVIGSGLAGVACAKALIARGEEVTMLDAGLDLEAELQQVVSGLSKQTSEQWAPESLARIKLLGAGSGVPRKLVYGSDYVYQHPEGQSRVSGKGVDFAPSYALGGLSNAWGAAMLPYLESDIDDWPLSIDDLAPYYTQVLDFVPMAATNDALAERFPLYTERFCEHRESKRAARFLANLERHRDDLARDGWSFGKSRLAVTVKGCTYCGLCMFGCPYGLIYSSRETLAQLRLDPGFTYVGGVVVERLEETSDGVAIRARTLDGEPQRFAAERVFVGGGAIPTTQLILDSLGIQETTLRDSQYFLMPLLTPGGGGAKDELHTLAQLFVELQDPSISDRNVHLQLYTYNQIYDLEFRRRFGRLYPVLPTGIIGDRMSLMQGFLHSDDSFRVRVRRGQDGTLTLKKIANTWTRNVVKRVVGRIRGLSLRLGAAPALPMLQIAEPGKSFHFGGTFPMSQHPERGQTDTLGRPQGLERVHLIDSSVFPSIPATTISLSVMANAYRIATEHGD
jgi:choline dehydrogenase-like flavoprotein